MKTDTVSKMVAAKAKQLLDEGRVRWLHGRKYWVQGFSGEYTVVLWSAAEGEGACTCKAGRGCSHVLAACGYEQANPLPVVKDDSDPFEGIN